MKVMAINASPHKNGNTAFLMDSACEEFKKAEYEIIKVDLYDLSITGCKACYYCKSHDDCVINDEMQNIYRLMKKSDIIVIGSPIYFGAETGVLKIFMDRLYAFIDDKRKPKISGKKFIMITVSGAPGEYYKTVTERIAGIFSGFFKFEPIGVFTCGGMGRKLTADKNPEMIEKIRSAVKKFLDN